ncbi:MAG: class I SAM-dependent methyltransferase, partial [Corynebacterium variabile]|nr:class I SAM-dependent methyltransferase [Corynebacterium variabile]
MSRASLEKDPHDVASMFDAVGKNYDLTNTVLSFGQDRLWRKRTRRRLGLGPRAKVHHHPPRPPGNPGARPPS